MKTIQAMTQTILDSGYTEAQIAAEIGLTQPAVNFLKSGIRKSTNYETGKKIEALHAKVMAKNRRLAKAGAAKNA